MKSPGHALVGSIGTSEYDTVTYELAGETINTKLSPVALTNLINAHSELEFNIDAAVIFRTKEAGDENDRIIKDGLDEAGIECEFVDIRLVKNQADVDSILQTVSDYLLNIEQDSVVLDTSHSFRTLPMVFLVSLMYIDALEETTTLEKIYYSRWAGSRERDRAPVVDLTYLRTLFEWHDAFKSAQRTGTLRGVRLLLKRKRREFFVDRESTHPSYNDFGNFVDKFKSAQRAIDTGFPLEAGIGGKNALDSLADLDQDEFVGPEGMVLDPLENIIDEFVEIDQTVSEKSEYQPTIDELRREAEIVEFYVNHDKYGMALEIARELFINRVLYDTDHTDDWLTEDTRKCARPPHENSDKKQKRVSSDAVSLWSDISSARNKYAHAGFKTDNRPSDDKVEDWLTTLCEKIDEDSFWERSDKESQ